MRSVFDMPKDWPDFGSCNDMFSFVPMRSRFSPSQDPPFLGPLPASFPFWPKNHQRHLPVWHFPREARNDDGLQDLRDALERAEEAVSASSSDTEEERERKEELAWLRRERYGGYSLVTVGAD